MRCGRMLKLLFVSIAFLGLVSCGGGGQYSYNSSFSSIKQASSSVVASFGNSNKRAASTNFKSSITSFKKIGSTTLSAGY